MDANELKKQILFYSNIVKDLQNKLESLKPSKRISHQAIAKYELKQGLSVIKEPLTMDEAMAELLSGKATEKVVEFKPKPKRKPFELYIPPKHTLKIADKYFAEWDELKSKKIRERPFNNKLESLSLDRKVMLDKFSEMLSENYYDNAYLVRLNKKVSKKDFINKVIPHVKFDFKQVLKNKQTGYGADESNNAVNYITRGLLYYYLTYIKDLNVKNFNPHNRNQHFEIPIAVVFRKELDKLLRQIL